MSLDISLILKEPISKKKKSSGIFVRENGSNVEISLEEWNIRYPNKIPVTFQSEEDDDDDSQEVYSANITHNLNTMAEAAGIYKELWHPDEVGITTAKQLIDPLREGLHKLKLNPDEYMKYNPPNGWGSYESLVKFVEKYLDACYEYPEAIVEACA